MTALDPHQQIDQLESQKTTLAIALHELDEWVARPPSIDSSEWFGLAALAHGVLLRSVRAAVLRGRDAVAEAHAATASAIGALDG